MEAKLIVVGGDVKTTEIKLKLPCIIGRGRGTGLMLPHPLVSRQHCEIYEHESQLVVRDLGSLNGTYINNTRLTEATILPTGDLLTVGTVTFRAEYAVDPNLKPPAPNAKTVRSSPARQTVSLAPSATPSSSPDFSELMNDEPSDVEDVEEVAEVDAAPQVANLDAIPSVKKGDGLVDDIMSMFDDDAEEVEEVEEVSPKATQPAANQAPAQKTPAPKIAPPEAKTAPKTPAPNEPAPAKTTASKSPATSGGKSSAPQPSSRWALPSDDNETLQAKPEKNEFKIDVKGADKGKSGGSKAAAPVAPAPKPEPEAKAKPTSKATPIIAPPAEAAADDEATFLADLGIADKPASKEADPLAFLAALSQGSAQPVAEVPSFTEAKPTPPAAEEAVIEEVAIEEVVEEVAEEEVAEWPVVEPVSEELPIEMIEEVVDVAEVEEEVDFGAFAATPLVDDAPVASEPAAIEPMNFVEESPVDSRSLDVEELVDVEEIEEVAIVAEPDAELPTPDLPTELPAPASTNDDDVLDFLSASDEPAAESQPEFTASEPFAMVEAPVVQEPFISEPAASPPTIDFMAFLTDPVEEPAVEHATPDPVVLEPVAPRAADLTVPNVEQMETIEVLDMVDVEIEEEPAPAVAESPEPVVESAPARPKPHAAPPTFAAPYARPNVSPAPIAPPAASMVNTPVASAPPAAAVPARRPHAAPRPKGSAPAPIIGPPPEAPASDENSAQSPTPAPADDDLASFLKNLGQ